MLIVDQLQVSMILKQYIIYFLFYFSKHESNMYQSGSTADIEIKLLLDHVPANFFPPKRYDIEFSLHILFLTSHYFSCAVSIFFVVNFRSFHNDNNLILSYKT